MTLLTPATRSHFGAVKYDVIASGRPWWQVRYRDGKEIAEWETPPAVVTKHARPDASVWRKSRWEETKKQGILAMRLLCPNGMAAELDTDRLVPSFIELKVGGQDIAITAGASRRFTDANLIGVLRDDNGTLDVWAFERAPHPLALDLETLRCVTCNLEAGICTGRTMTVTRRDELIEHAPDPAWPERLVRERVFIDELVGTWTPLVTFKDNIHNMRYRRIGPLSLDVQGVRI